jgi:hypothetical protein
MGDGRQIGPVVKRGGMIDTIAASLFQSYVWPEFHVFEFKENMRLSGARNVPADTWTDEQRQDYHEQVAFAANLLCIGNGQSDGINAQLLSQDHSNG